VRIPNRGALPIIASVSLTHFPCLFACFYESVSCVYVVFSTCPSTVRAAFFAFCSIFLTTFLFLFSFPTNLIDTYVTVSTHVRIFLRICLHSFLHLHLHFSNSFVCVSEHVYAFPLSSILIHIHDHIHMYVMCYVLYLYPLFVSFLLHLQV